MKNRYFIFILLSFISPFAMAHAGHTGNHGFESGFMHPLSGLDHLSVMVGVGMMAALFGGRARWIMPVAFIASMIVGGILGITGLIIPYVEAGIVMSVVVMGLMLFRGAQLPYRVVVGFVMAFAVFHGMAHGAEMPIDSHAIYYFTGFVLSTALLHFTGVVLGEGVLRISSDGRLAKAVGAVVALFGLSMLFS